MQVIGVTCCTNADKAIAIQFAARYCSAPPPQSAVRGGNLGPTSLGPISCAKYVSRQHASALRR